MKDITMHDRTTFFQNQNKTFQAVVFAIMACLIPVCLIVAAQNNIFRNSYVCVGNLTTMAGLVFLTALSGYLLKKSDGKNPALRYFSLFLLSIYLTLFLVSLIYSLYQLPNHEDLLTIITTVSYFGSFFILLTLWLYQKQFLEETFVTRAVTVLMVVALMLYAFALIVNLREPIVFRYTAEGVLSPDIPDYYSMFMGLFCLLLLCVATFSSNLSFSRKFSFFSCIFVPVLFTILFVNPNLIFQNTDFWGILNTTFLLPLCLLFFNVHDALEKDVLRHEKEETQLRLSAMISQMQPHFLYNALAVIEALCETDPKLAAEATNAFAHYLRENMDFADKASPISFSEELKHIEKYVWLETLRFPNKLRVEYDIACTAFPVPALSVQPMVENAIKHGICKSKHGGTVRLSTVETDSAYRIVVADDGKGFDPQGILAEGGRHLGIANTRYRVGQMVGGSLEIESRPGEGTAVTITVPKQRWKTQP